MQKSWNCKNAKKILKIQFFLCKFLFNFPPKNYVFTFFYLFFQINLKKKLRIFGENFFTFFTFLRFFVGIFFVGHFFLFRPFFSNVLLKYFYFQVFNFKFLARKVAELAIFLSAILFFYHPFFFKYCFRIFGEHFKSLARKLAESAIFFVSHFIFVGHFVFKPIFKIFVYNFWRKFQVSSSKNGWVPGTKEDTYYIYVSIYLGVIIQSKLCKCPSVPVWTITPKMNQAHSQPPKMIQVDMYPQIWKHVNKKYVSPLNWHTPLRIFLAPSLNIVYTKIT